MTARRRRRKDAELSQLRDHILRRERRLERLRRCASLRRLRVIGLCAVCVLFGGAFGVVSARHNGEPAASAEQAAMNLPADALESEAARRPVQKTWREGARAMPGDAARRIVERAPEGAVAHQAASDDTAPEEAAPAPADEAILARLYEERITDDIAPPAPPGVEPARLSYGPPFVPVPKTTDPPAWQRYAVPVAASGARPMIAIVLDDLGLNRPGTRRAIALPGPLTLSFMTYANDLPHLTSAARAAGHELMLHVPMEPQGANYDPGPNVLSDSLGVGELHERLNWGLARFDGFVGINNHMGSRFSTSSEGMYAVMRTLRARGLLFLDSVTSPASVGAAMAARVGVPFARRDVFIDNVWNDPGAIARQLDRVERLARTRGYAVAIGHPHRATLDVLETWLLEARRRGFEFVPVSAIVRHRFGIAQNAARPAD